MTSEEEKFQLELKSIFLEELEDGLEKIEASFLKFDSNRDNYEIVHDIFRNFHNIKGSSKTVGFEDLSNFAHSAENLLSLIRDGEIKASDEIVSSLLVCLDIMRSYSEAIQKGDNSFNEKLISHSKVLDHHIDSAPRIGSQSLGTEEKKPEVDTGFGFFEDEPKTKVQDELEEPNVIRKDKIDEGSITESQEIEENAKKEIENNTDGKNSEPTSAGNTITKSSLSMLMKEESLKVSMPKINQILDLFGEQVIIQSALDHEMQKENVDMDYVEKSIGQLRKITQDLQHTLVTLRMVSMETLFNRMQRSIRDVALITNKKVDFIKIGQTSELDKSIVDSLVDPLTHMVRNAVDHGLELPEDRLKSGKPELGTVTMKAQRHGGTFEITIEDDGKGINKKNILDKAIKKGIVKDGAHLSDNQVFNLIFESGFSTLDSASVISGRGVGMDVVKQQIKKLKGVVDISSEEGKGSKFTIRVPLSLAMFNGTILIINKQKYVVPNSDFHEALNLSNLGDLSTKSGSVHRIGERLLNVIDLRNIITHKNGLEMENGTDSENDNIISINKNTNKNLAIVVEYNKQEFALIVDNILSQEQIVLKELGPEAKQIRGTSGGTILGDGKVALVLDVVSIIKREIYSKFGKAV